MKNIIIPDFGITFQSVVYLSILCVPLLTVPEIHHCFLHLHKAIILEERNYVSSKEMKLAHLELIKILTFFC